MAEHQHFTPEILAVIKKLADFHELLTTGTHDQMPSDKDFDEMDAAFDELTKVTADLVREAADLIKDKKFDEMVDPTPILEMLPRIAKWTTFAGWMSRIPEVLMRYRKTIKLDRMMLELAKGQVTSIKDPAIISILLPGGKWPGGMPIVPPPDDTQQATPPPPTQIPEVKSLRDKMRERGFSPD